VPKRKAFTLIELLLVIAVIAVLLAILMPALRAAKEQAKKTVCTGHVKGLVLALRMYADDYGGKTHRSPNYGLWDNEWQHPAVVTKYGPNDNMAYWGVAYQPYAQNKKIFRCPSTKRVDDWPENGSPWGLPSQKYFKYCSYGLNGYITDKKIDIEFKHQSEVIAFQDHIEQLLDDNGDMFHIRPQDKINLTQWRNGGTLGNFPEAVQECFRHRGVSMTSWLDGHVTEVEETTGENVPRRWYTGKLP
jgi:prepilin-type N-terminal cleavage/methylation domain-containing protein/prepilin-type processing-associated H-X9-DG protein